MEADHREYGKTPRLLICLNYCKPLLTNLHCSVLFWVTETRFTHGIFKVPHNSVSPEHPPLSVIVPNSDYKFTSVKLVGV